MANVTTDHQVVLLKAILRITSARARILSENLAAIDRDQFTPQDLPIDRLADRLQSLTDGNQIESLSHTAVMASEPDEYGTRLLQTDKAGYIRYQQRKLLENYLNEMIARRILYHCTGHQQAGWPLDRVNATNNLKWRQDE